MIKDYGSKDNFWDEMQALIQLIENYPKKEQKHHLPWFYDNVKDIVERYQKL